MENQSFLGVSIKLLQIDMSDKLVMESRNGAYRTTAKKPVQAYKQPRVENLQDSVVRGVAANHGKALVQQRKRSLGEQS